MADIKCSICGQSNPADLTICQNCGASLPRGGQSIQPGQEPTRKTTSELEQGLPSWLREARNQRQSSPDEAPLSPSQPSASPSSRRSGMDLLAGLQSQADDDDDELPAWLTNLTGGADTSKKQAPESTEGRRVELGDPGKPKEREDELPSWLASLSASASETDERNKQDAPASGPFGAFTDLEAPTQAEEAGSDWLASLQSDASMSAESSESETNVFANVDLPDWMKTEEPATPTSQADSAQDWLNSRIEPSIPEPASAADAFEAPVDTADWLKSLDAPQAPSVPSSPAAESSNDDMPDWLKGMGEATIPLSSQPSEVESTDYDMPDWIKSMGNAPTPEPATPAAPQPSAPADLGSDNWFKSTPEPMAPQPATDSDFFMPDWLKGAEETPNPAAPQSSVTADVDETPAWLKSVETAAPTADDLEMPAWLKGASEPASPQPSASEFNVDLPSWLKSAKMETDDEPAQAKPFAPAEPSIPSASSGPVFVPAFTDFPMDEASIIDTPDWLTNLGKTPEPANLSAPETSMPSPIPEDMDAEFNREPQAGEFDALFSDMPEWLNSSSLSAAPAGDQHPPAESADASLSPASLPSWVQAMRPVDAAASILEAAAAGETMETRGPFAGLQGVLPSAPYPGASSKPKSLAVKLQADDEQQTHAALLEQIMTAEAYAEPMVTSAGVNSQRILRIAIFALLLVIVAGTVFMGTQIFPMPIGRPAETMAAFNAVDAVLPPDAPVLLVFDYEPALAGEMEAVAAPLLDHMIVTKHPRMALLSTSPTGAVMAARMFEGQLGELPAIQYVNLGYLPGGLSAVRAFAQDPVNTLVLPADVSIFNLAPAPVWASPTLQGVQSFSNFAAIILITDSAEAGRTWIEQAGPLRGSAQFVVVSSAQAGPLLQPYYSSGQINGLASGVYDAAVLEQNNAGRPGNARRYWDAYSLSLALALVLLVGGALWSLAANLRERIVSKEGG